MSQGPVDARRAALDQLAKGAGGQAGRPMLTALAGKGQRAADRGRFVRNYEDGTSVSGYMDTPLPQQRSRVPTPAPLTSSYGKGRQIA